jgi:hypothetical protein
MAHPIGLAALTVLELAPPDRVSCAADAGFDCVGLRLLPATADEVQLAIVGDTPLVRDVFFTVYRNRSLNGHTRIAR